MAIFSIVMLFSVLLMAGLGILIKYFDVHWLISGYNTMSDEEKKNVDIKKLAKLIGNMCLLLAGIMFIATILIVFKLELLGTVVLISTIPISLVMVIKSQKYDNNSRNSDGSMKTSSKVKVIVISGIMIITTIGIGIMLYLDMQPTDVIIDNETLIIKGMYGEKIPLAEIDDFYLKDTIPKITFKNNGSAIGSKKKGNFKLEEIGRAKLFLDTSIPSYIYIIWNKKIIILNSKSTLDTVEIFEKVVLKLDMKN